MGGDTTFSITVSHAGVKTDSADHHNEATVAIAGHGGGFKWQTGITAPNGMIYALPPYANTVLKINPVTDTTTTFGELGEEAYKWRHGVVAMNGNIYAVPDTAQTVLKIEPFT